MKLLRNGFAFGIAILTISLTIAAHAGAFKSEKKVAKKQQTCSPSVRPVGPNEALYTIDAAGECVLYTGSLVCNNLPSPLYSQATVPAYTSFSCPVIAQPQFCCAALNAQDDCDLEGAQRFRITNILCGQRP